MVITLRRPNANSTHTAARRASTRMPHHRMALFFQYMAGEVLFEEQAYLQPIQMANPSYGTSVPKAIT